MEEKTSKPFDWNKALGSLGAGLGIASSALDNIYSIDSSNLENQINAAKNISFNAVDNATLMEEINSWKPLDTNYGVKDVGFNWGNQLGNIGAATIAGLGLGKKHALGGALKALGAIAGIGSTIYSYVDAKNQANLMEKEAEKTNLHNQIKARYAINDAESIADNLMKQNAFASGGGMSPNNLGISFINEGGTHEQNPFGGVPMGIAEDGSQNLVEEGEIIYDDYVFSNRLEVPQELKDKYNIKDKSITFANAVKRLMKPYMDNLEDNINKNGIEALMREFIEVQEQIRQENNIQNNNQKAYGGDNNDITPEEIEAFLQNQIIYGRLRSMNLNSTNHDYLDFSELMNSQSSTLGDILSFYPGQIEGFIDDLYSTLERQSKQIGNQPIKKEDVAKFVYSRSNSVGDPYLTLLNYQTGRLENTKFGDYWESKDPTAFFNSLDNVTKAFYNNSFDVNSEDWKTVSKQAKEYAEYLKSKGLKSSANDINRYIDNIESKKGAANGDFTSLSFQLYNNIRVADYSKMTGSSFGTIEKAYADYLESLNEHYFPEKFEVNDENVNSLQRRSLPLRVFKYLSDKFGLKKKREATKNKTENFLELTDIKTPDLLTHFELSPDNIVKVKESVVSPDMIREANEDYEEVLKGEKLYDDINNYIMSQYYNSLYNTYSPSAEVVPIKVEENIIEEPLKLFYRPQITPITVAKKQSTIPIDDILFGPEEDIIVDNVQVINPNKVGTGQNNTTTSSSEVTDQNNTTTSSSEVTDQNNTTTSSDPITDDLKNPKQMNYQNLLKYAPAFINAAALASNIIKKPDYSYAERLENSLTAPRHIKPQLLTGKLQYTPEDINYLVNKGIATGAATRNALLNSGISAGAARANTLAQNYADIENINKIYSEGLARNLSKKMNYAQYNLGIDQANAQAINRANEFNTQIDDAYRNAYMDMLKTGTSIRMQEDTNRAQAIGSGLTSFGNNLHSIYRDDITDAQAKFAISYMPYLNEEGRTLLAKQFGIDQNNDTTNRDSVSVDQNGDTTDRAKGGKINRKKKRKGLTY